MNIMNFFQALLDGLGMKKASVVIVQARTEPCQCPNCRSMTEAEHLLRLAEFVRLPKDEVLLPGINRPHVRDDTVGNVKLALDFQDRGPAFHFAAIYEGWSRDEIIRRLR